MAGLLPDDLVEMAAAVLDGCRARGWTLATAESCTGGLIVGCLTEVAGSSSVVDRGFVTYSNTAKAEALGVPPELIDAHGAVSEQVAKAMVIGALARSGADLAVAVTGIAGPGGGNAEKPVGLVHFGCARSGRPVAHERHVFDGGRSEVRRETVRTALGLLLNMAQAADI